MAIYYGDDCDQNVVDPECSLCVDNPELAGIGQAALVHKSYYPTIAANPTSGAVWLTGIQQGKVKVIPGIRGDFDGGSPVYGPGYGRRKQTLMGNDYKGNLYDPNYIDNAPFYNSILKTANWHVAVSTETQTHLSDNPVTFAPKNPMADDITKNMEWATEFSFFQNDLFMPFNTPDGIFDCSWTS